MEIKIALKSEGVIIKKFIKTNPIKHQNDELINEEIVSKFPEILLISPDDEKTGKNKLIKIASKVADDQAKVQGLDLVCVSLKKADIPICRIMNYGKFKYQQKLKQRKQNAATLRQKLKQIKLRPQIGEGDLNTKTRRIVSFLKAGHQVKVLVMFRGREVLNKEKGLTIINNIINEVKDYLKIVPEVKFAQNVYQTVLNPIVVNKKKPKSNLNNKNEKNQT
ncbi:translation initiation factor IF-3 [Mycoplasma sp. SG1]|uniref:translation initiation factor IF-3 n=1 Tax=Mycoplasma sp. SG1 TaxID=2810348 RepID=UPI002AFE1CB8|nr:translation initiation factor IF-3 [Mycoplasma sp. SG1]URM53252.1 translation initiation factor IF-3 [Mycoplasma sp. SG1]